MKLKTAKHTTDSIETVSTHALAYAWLHTPLYVEVTPICTGVYKQNALASSWQELWNCVKRDLLKIKKKKKSVYWP